MNRFIFLAIFSYLFLACNPTSKNRFSFHRPGDSPKIEFAIAEIQQYAKGININETNIDFKLDTVLGPQAYQLSSSTKHKITISGGDETGLMYGGLELAELIRMNKGIPDLSQPVSGSPYIEQRGLKFNIPLDIRTPSYQDAGDAAQQNIAEMWNFDFWKAYFDMMARNRYNVLTLWNPHPFPSMIKMEAYPDIALENVCGTSFPLDTDRLDEPDAKFIAGCGVSQQVLDNLTVLKEMTIDEKIDFWQRVMKYAKNRGIDVYFITWNIKLNSVAPPGWYREQETKMGDKGKYGINNDQENPRTIAYLRAAVKEFILTYPDLAGIGITAGENMENRTDEFDREKWLWATYGQGVVDAKQVQPDREVKFIHRYWQSGVGTIVDDFISKYPDEINLSFKYARARMYATPAPRWADEFIKEYSAYGLKSWWNVRNDDIFHFRWGDPAYASEFIKNIPPTEVTAGYYMGSDGYVWGREFISKHPQSPRELEIDKHWYNFMLWGRMGYNPDMDRERIEAMVLWHYPGAPADALYDAWATASKIPSKVTSFHWNNWDFQWAVEGCLDLRDGFHTVERFIHNPTMDGLGILTIPQYVESLQMNSQYMGTTPLQIADQLDSLAKQVLTFTDAQIVSEGKINSSYDELLYDLRAWASMGKYYADKIRGAFYLHAYRSGMGDENQQKAIASLTSALQNWKAYAAAASRNYKPQFMAKTRTIDWETLTHDVANDIELARSNK